MKAALVLLACAPVWAQPPRLTNAKLETRAAAAGLEGELRSIMAATAGPVWTGWAVRATPGEHQMCCYSSFEDGAGNRCCRGCGLEGVRGSGAAANSLPGPISLEASGYIFVLVRVEQHAVDRIRTFSAECELDGGGLPFYWLTGVKPAESVAWLTGVASGPEDEDRRRHRRSEPAIAAIALHDDPSADQALERLVAPGQPEAVRERVVFWLGSARGRRGFDMLERLLEQDTSDRVREKATFGLSVSPVPEATRALIETAKNDRSARVRGQALFWLAQKAGQKPLQSPMPSTMTRTPKSRKRPCLRCSSSRAMRASRC